MVEGSFRVQHLRFMGSFDLQFGKGTKGFFYQIQDLRTYQIVDVKDNLTGGQFFDSIKDALDPSQIGEFKQLCNQL